MLRTICLWRKVPMLQSQSGQDFDVTAVLHEEVTIPLGHATEPFGKSCLKSCLHNGAEGVIVGQVRRSLVHANKVGHGLLDKVRQLEQDITILKAEDKKWETQKWQTQKWQTQIDEQGRHIVSLENRFLDQCEKDFRKEELSHPNTIQPGDVRAHKGDALGDATLFDRDQGTDRKIHRELYGLDIQQLLDYNSKNGDGGLHLILNAHATTVAKARPVVDDVKVAFDSFIAKVEDNWLQSPTQNPNTLLGRAYHTFWRGFNDQPRI